MKKQKQKVTKMQKEWGKIFSQCQLGDKRLASRAVNIGEAISKNFGQGLSSMFASGNELKRAYEFSAMIKPASKKSSLPIA